MHKSPALELVAIFTLGPSSGPLPEHVPLVQQLQKDYQDDLIFALFHPEAVLEGDLTGGKLPLSLYQPYYESGSENADKGLQMDGWGMGRQLQLRFKELRYEVETGEAEMIGVDFVARGGGNASAIQPAAGASAQEAGSKSKGKGKAPLTTETNEVSGQSVLSPEDDERESIFPPLSLLLHADQMSSSHRLIDRQSERHQDASPAHQPHPRLSFITPAIIPHRPKSSHSRDGPTHRPRPLTQHLLAPLSHPTTRTTIQDLLNNISHISHRHNDHTFPTASDVSLLPLHSLSRRDIRRPPRLPTLKPDAHHR